MLNFAFLREAKDAHFTSPAFEALNAIKNDSLTLFVNFFDVEQVIGI